MLPFDLILSSASLINDGLRRMPRDDMTGWLYSTPYLHIEREQCLCFALGIPLNSIAPMSVYNTILGPPSS